MSLNNVYMIMICKKCPCINCITLPICKARIKDGDLFVSLVTRCSLFNNYCTINDFVFHSEKYQTLMDIFGDNHG